MVFLLLRALFRWSWILKKKRGEKRPLLLFQERTLKPIWDILQYTDLSVINHRQHSNSNNTRFSCEKNALPLKARTNYDKQRICFAGIKRWNTLQTSLKNLTSLTSFKTRSSRLHRLAVLFGKRISFLCLYIIELQTNYLPRCLIYLFWILTLSLFFFF